MTMDRRTLPTPPVSVLALIAAAWLAASMDLNAQPLFDSDDVLSAVMTVPLNQTYRQRKLDDRAYFAGHWSYQNEDGEKVRLPLQVRSRGNFRRLNCRLPPLQLNFRKSTVPGTLLAGQDKLKLVGPCTSSTSSQQRVLVEELIYRLFEIVAGDAAFATRRVELSYVDADRQYTPREHQTFVIESLDNLADRLGGKEHKVLRTTYDALDAEQAALIEVFQFMIGNTDFSLVASRQGDDECCHNIKLIERKSSSGGLLPIPYDFDHAGLVDAPYALPSDRLPINSVRKRFYMGVCRPPELIESAVARILGQRDTIVGTVDATAGMTQGTRKKVLKYLDGFFEIASEPKRVQRDIVAECRG